MNSKFVVSDLCGYSPLDVGTPAFVKVPHASAPTPLSESSSSSVMSGKKGQEVLRLFVEPTVRKRK